MRIKLHWKLTALFCLMVAVLLGVTYFYLDSHLKDYMGRRIREDVVKDLYLGKELLDVEIGGNALPADTDRLADKIGKALGLRATIVGIDGKVLGDSDLDAAGLAKAENHSDRPEIRQALNSGFGESGNRYSYTLKKYMHYMAVPLGKDKPVGVLRLSIPLADIHIIEAGMIKITLIAVMLGLLIAVVLSGALSFFITRPIARISEAARAIAGGDFSKKVIIGSRGEIGALASDLNRMADEIKSRMDQVTSGEARLESVLLGMAEGLVVTDSKGDIILANPSARRYFFIDTPPEGKRPLEVVRNSAVQSAVDRIIKEAQGFISEEISINFPEERSMKMSAVPIVRDGAREGAILVFHDITELRRLENIRKDFVANVSHELRTPLSSIKGYAETLKDGSVGGPEVKDFLDIIYRESDRLAKLIDDLLDLSRIESGKMAMAFVPMDLGSVAKRVCAILEKQSASKSISVGLEVPADLPRVLADEGRLSQVIMNLLDNAVKYTPEGGKIRLSAAIEGKFVRVDISDTGVGIPEEDILRIFERFYRVDKARSRELGGTGLGLSIVKHIVQAHGGRVWAVSSPGRGSTFSFTIPIA
jgi:two-component system phosphate regulon sensor histidine kinase PhoR